MPSGNLETSKKAFSRINHTDVYNCINICRELSFVITSWLGTSITRVLMIRIDDLGDERDNPPKTGIHPPDISPETNLQALLIRLDNNYTAGKR